ncbi:MAG: hypothetical protein ACXWKR_15795 [Phenylobacterium sp.]
MKLQPLLLALTIANAAMLTINLATAHASHAEAVAPVLRGRALEIVDERGRVRATISVLPGDAAYRMPDGTIGYPETTLLRLIDQHGRPNVKVSATEQGGGVGLGGEKDPTYIHLEAKGPATALRLINRDGRDKVLTP